MAEAKTIFELLLEVQAELNVPKNMTNSFGGYKYRNAESILEAVKPILKKKGLVILLADEVQNIGDRNYVKSVAKITDGKNEVYSTAYAREQENRKGMDEAQITGASSSYARKYALGGLLAIDDGNDQDSMDNREQPAVKAKTPAPISVKQKQYIASLHKELGGNTTVKEFIVDEGYDPDKMTSEEASELIEILQERAVELRNG